VTTTFFLVRHAAHDNVGGFLAGRSEGVRLGKDGLAQAQRLAERMTRETFDAIHASPRERTQETAATIAAACGVGPVATAEELDEIDFGHWAGKTFDLLNADPHWRRWNTARSLTRTPAGEAMIDVQQRVLRLMERLNEDGGGRRIVLVSHGDVIKAAVMHVLGLPIDAWPRFEIAPASITSVAVDDWGAKVLTLNEVVW